MGLRHGAWQGWGRGRGWARIREWQVASGLQCIECEPCPLQHVVGHHIFTNIDGADPDVFTDHPEKPFYLRIKWKQKWLPHYLYQHVYIFAIYSLVRPYCCHVLPTLLPCVLPTLLSLDTHPLPPPCLSPFLSCLCACVCLCVVQLAVNKRIQDFAYMFGQRNGTLCAVKPHSVVWCVMSLLPVTMQPPLGSQR